MMAPAPVTRDQIFSTEKKIKVTLSTIGKFHTWDLARQLFLRSALAGIFTAYPWFKLQKENLPRKLVHTFPWLHAPYMRFPHEIFSEGFIKDWEWLDRYLFDRYTAFRLPDCHVFSGLSSSALNTGIKAKLRGAKYVCDRGSSHILFQDRLLREEFDRHGIRFSGIDRRIIEREQAEYEVADVITVPSTFALRSFLAEGVQEQKMRLIPYGVDMSRFYPVGRPDDRVFDVLFAGMVSVRKGVLDLLRAFDLFAHPKKRLTIVGSPSAELKDKIHKIESSRADIRVLGHVPQSELPQYMSRAHVMVLPSIEEGLALVQAQAMACGCPIIASTNTGAEDLFANGVEGFIVPIRDPGAIAHSLQKLADDRQLRERMSAAALLKVRRIGGWDHYGEQMYRLFCDLVD